MECIKSDTYLSCGIAKVDNVGYGFVMTDQYQDIDKALQRNLMRIIDERFGGNQAAFCRALGFNPTYINAIVKGHKNLGKPNWEKIRKALDLRPDEFTQGIDSPIVKDKEEQKVVDWYRDMVSAGMVKEAEMMMGYLTTAAKKKEEPSDEGKAGGVPRGAHKRK